MTSAAARYLIDTHCILWWAHEPEKLPKSFLKIFDDESATCFFSVASSLEMAIKIQIGKLTLPTSLDQFIEKIMNDGSFIPLPITHEHSLKVAKLPMHHRDPFDRILVAQAMVDDLRLMTLDKNLSRYKIRLA